MKLSVYTLYKYHYLAKIMLLAVSENKQFFDTIKSTHFYGTYKENADDNKQITYFTQKLNEIMQSKPLQYKVNRMLNYEMCYQNKLLK